MAIGIGLSISAFIFDEQFEELHGYLATEPWLEDDPPGQRTPYRDDLLTARALLGTAFGFDAANLGDENGTDGW